MKLIFENSVNEKRAEFLVKKAAQFRKQDSVYKNLSLEYHMGPIVHGKKSEQVVIRAERFSNDDMRFGIDLASHLKTFVILKDDACERKISGKTYGQILLTFDDASKELLLKGDYPDMAHTREAALNKMITHTNNS